MIQVNKLTAILSPIANPASRPEIVINPWKNYCGKAILSRIRT